MERRSAGWRGGEEAGGREGEGKGRGEGVEAVRGREESARWPVEGRVEVAEEEEEEGEEGRGDKAHETELVGREAWAYAPADEEASIPVSTAPSPSRGGEGEAAEGKGDDREGRADGAAEEEAEEGGNGSPASLPAVDGTAVSGYVPSSSSSPTPSRPLCPSATME